MSDSDKDTKPEEQAPSPKRPGRTIPIVIVVLLALVGLWRFWASRGYETTDDAYVVADIVQVSAQVGGQILTLSVKDNELVKAGDVIATIDPATYRVKVSQAEANLQAAQAQVAAAQADYDLTAKQGASQVDAAQGGAMSAAHGFEAAEAQVKAARAQLDSAREAATSSVLDLHNQDADVEAARSAVSRADAAILAANQAVRASRATGDSADAAVVAAQAADKASEADLVRQRSLLDVGAISQSDYDHQASVTAGARAALTQSRRGVDAARAGVQQRLADLESAKAAATSSRASLAQAIQRRKQGDAKVRQADAGTRVAEGNLGAVLTSVGSARGSVVQANANVSSAQTLPQKLSQKASALKLAQAQVEQAKAALASAKLDLERTVVKSPIDGRVSKRYVSVGYLATASMPVASVVPSNPPYLVANFKETQIERIRPGQKVEVEIDGFDAHPFEGVVDSLSAATGSQFALIPPDNATGNFVKVVQRVPVKITFPQQRDLDRLSAGLSATVKIRTSAP